MANDLKTVPCWLTAEALADLTADVPCNLLAKWWLLESQLSLSMDAEKDDISGFDISHLDSHPNSHFIM